MFDEAWYLQDSCPPAAQLLYDLGLKDDDSTTPQPTYTPMRVDTPWPPLPPVPGTKKWFPPCQCLRLPLPLQLTSQPTLVAAKATRVRSTQSGRAPSRKQIASEVVTEFHIDRRDMELIYMSPDPYGCAFEAYLDLQKCDLTHHRTAGLRLFTKNERLVHSGMDPSTPGEHIARWRTELQGAWLLSVDGRPVSTPNDIQRALIVASTFNPSMCSLFFSHPKVTPDISNRGIPVMSRDDFTQYTHDQLNNQLDLLADVNSDTPCVLRTRCYDIISSGNVRQYITRVMRLTCGRLLQQTNWLD
jgi:hypothetical protein